MATIDRQVLLADVNVWLHESNILSQAQLTSLAESVILKVGDDDIYYSEVLCKTLMAAAKANKALSAGGNDIKREKTYMEEIEYHNRTDSGLWDQYLESLPDVCPLLPGGGYSPRSPNSYGFYANVSDKVKVPDFSNYPWLN